jgi:glyoxylase I family protein
MDADVLFAGVPVADFATARAWYARFFGRSPDVVAHDEEVMWQVTGGGWLYVVRDQVRGGTARVAMAVPDIEETVRALEARGVTVGCIERQGDAGWKAVVADPEGNSIALVQVSSTR